LRYIFDKKFMIDFVNHRLSAARYRAQVCNRQCRPIDARNIITLSVCRYQLKGCDK